MPSEPITCAHSAPGSRAARTRPVRSGPAKLGYCIPTPATRPAGRQFRMSFGGFKQSGIGREGVLEGVLAFLKTKSIILDGAPAACQN
jgi:hypothetical protein